VQALQSGAKKHKPDHAQDQDGEPGRNGQESEHRGARLALAGLGRGFDDAAVSLRCRNPSPAGVDERRFRHLKASKASLPPLIVAS
jgi:hypothetical protein